MNNTFKTVCGPKYRALNGSTRSAARGARDIMLLEVSLPLASASEDWSEVRTTLIRAEGQFRNGDYTGCIASCRTVIEELGHRVYGERDWAPGALDKLAAGRKAMAKDERESALWATVRHYAHMAHHIPGEGGETDFSRPDAQWILRMTVATVAHCEAAFPSPNALAQRLANLAPDRRNTRRGQPRRARQGHVLAVMAYSRPARSGEDRSG